MAVAQRSGRTVGAPTPWTADLDLPGPVGRGQDGPWVRLVQGWLTLCGQGVVVDGDFGPATERAVRAFQRGAALPVTGVVDTGSYAALTEAMRVALRPLPPRGRSLGRLVAAAARRHLRARAREVGGQNRGPWVRLYTGGLEGPAYPWCAGFATFCVHQACTALQSDPPIPATLSCDAIAQTAEGLGLLLSGPGDALRRSIAPGSLFLQRARSGPLTYAHTGIVLATAAEWFTTIEGNTNDDGEPEGYEVCRRTRSFGEADFVTISRSGGDGHPG